MNKEALEALKQRAERAVKIAEQIDALNSLKGWEVPNRNYQGKDILEAGLMKELIGAGVKSLVAAKEAELELLLGQPPHEPEKPVVVQHTILPGVQVPVFPLPSDATCTAHQPAQPFAEVVCSH